MLKKETSSDDEIVWAMKLKKKWLALLKNSECSRTAAWLPKIHFVNPRDIRYNLVPVIVREADPKFHRYRLIVSRFPVHIRDIYRCLPPSEIRILSRRIEVKDEKMTKSGRRPRQPFLGAGEIVVATYHILERCLAKMELRGLPRPLTAAPVDKVHKVVLENADRGEVIGVRRGDELKQVEEVLLRLTALFSAACALISSPPNHSKDKSPRF
jgi:hypothetical protein